MIDATHRALAIVSVVLAGGAAPYGRTQTEVGFTRYSPLSRNDELARRRCRR